MAKKQQLQKRAPHEAVYMPLGGREEVRLTMEIVLEYLVSPTKSGKKPPIGELVKFIKLCKARELDPWVGDAFFLGYETKDGPKWSVITSIQALLKRAEASGRFDGLEGGIIVLRDETIQERAGTLGPLPGEQLLGGWAKCYVKQVRIPFYSNLNFTAYNKGYGLWRENPTVMITKCAKAAVLREAFPTQLGGLYTVEEMDHVEGSQPDMIEGLTGRLREAKLHRTLVDKVEPEEPAAVEEAKEDPKKPAPAEPPAEEPEVEDGTPIETEDDW